MLRLAALFGLMAAPAIADVAQISNCEFKHDESRSFLTCDVLNRSETAIAGLESHAQISETGRTVPWVSIKPDWPTPQRINGGIEPDETRRLLFWHGRLPELADMDALAPTVTIVRATDINGDPITTPD